MIGPLDTATLARRRIIPFWGWERYDSRISEQKVLPMDRALSLARKTDTPHKPQIAKPKKNKKKVRVDFSRLTAGLDLSPVAGQIKGSPWYCR